MEHRVLRELIRHLQQFEALFETSGIDTIKHAGVEYCLADIKRLYESRNLLSLRQAQAIEKFLYEDWRERDVAIWMGVSPVNPVAIYATQGLKRLCEMYNTGIWPGEEEPSDDGISAAQAGQDAAPLRRVPCV